MAKCAVRPADKIVISVSGGCDSLALALVSRSFFKPNSIHAITIDHQVRPHSNEEATEVSKILKANDFKIHRVLKIEWEEQPAINKIEFLCRKFRYDLLLNYCQENNINYLLTAHHLFDQMETVLHRFQMGSSLNGMKGIDPKMIYPSHPEVAVLRPFLGETKDTLQAVCREGNVNWLTDQSNFSPLFTRNCIRHILALNPTLATDLQDGIQFLHKFTDETQTQLLEFLRTSLTLEPNYGYYFCRLEDLMKFNRPIILRFFTHISRCVSYGSMHFLSFGCERVYMNLFHPKNEKPIQKSTITGGVVATLDREAKLVYIGKTQSLTKTEIKIGETKLWDDRFRITLNKENTDLNSEESYWIRGMGPTDQKFVFRAIRRVKATKLPVIHYRFSLPVVENKEGTAVFIPHFHYRDYNVNAECQCEFVPHPSSVHTVKKSSEFVKRRKYQLNEREHFLDS